MIRATSLVVGLMILLIGQAVGQEISIPDFPLGIGGSVGPEQFKPYHTELKAVADTLQKYRLARAVITGEADGERFWHNHDAQNPGVALGRAHVLRNLLIEEYGVAPSQIVIQSRETKKSGPEFRSVNLRIDRTLADLENRLQELEMRPPVERHFTEIKESSAPPAGPEENFGVQLGLGVSTSPFGGIPVATAALTWRRMIYLEAIVGHTFWNGSFRFGNDELDTKRRLIGGRVIYYPLDRIPLGLVGGWTRMEEISQEYYEYTRLSEGIMLGLRYNPVRFLSLTAAYHPAKSRHAEEELSDFDSDQFLAYLTAHLDFGGGK
ncbi:MAG: hypothetical protein HRF51_01230 [bacterium]|jgi:hypothetical protein